MRIWLAILCIKLMYLAMLVASRCVVCKHAHTHMHTHVCVCVCVRVRVRVRVHVHVCAPDLNVAFSLVCYHIPKIW